MLTVDEVLNAITDAELSCLDIDDESVEHDIDVVLNHLRRLYSTDSSREGIEAALRESGFESLGALWLKGILEARHWDDEGVSEIVNNKTNDCFTFTTVGQLLHLVAAAELAEQGRHNDN